MDKLEDAQNRIDRLSADLKDAYSDKVKRFQDSMVPQSTGQQLPLRGTPMPAMGLSPTHLRPAQDNFVGQYDQPMPAARSHRSHRSGRSRSRSHTEQQSRSSRSASRSTDTGSVPSARGRHIDMPGIFDVQIKPKDPPTFSGRTFDDPEVWVGQVSDFFSLVGGPSNKQVAYASTLLQGTAQTWWQRKVRAWEDPKDWESFAAQLIGRFKNTNKANVAMANLMNIRQRKEESTHDFIYRFEAELDKVDTYDGSWVLKMFIWGLP